MKNSLKENNRGLLNFLTGFNILLVAALVVRMFFCINETDEVFNIGESFRTVLGNGFLVENWDVFQTGDSFMFPFAKIFYLITGSSEGIVLFYRIIFLFVQALFGFVLYKLLKSTFDRNVSVNSILIFLSSILLKLYDMWYDNWEVFFRLLGLAVIYYCCMNKNNLSVKRRFACIFTAGILHAAMVYAYPTMLAYFVFNLFIILFYKNGKTFKQCFKWVLSYCLGAASVFAIFVVLLLKKGLKNVFLFNSDISSQALDSSGRSGLFSLERFFDAIYYFRTGLLKYLVPAIFVFFSILVCIYIKRRKKECFCLLLYL